jgi:hypothetical protein
MLIMDNPDLGKAANFPYATVDPEGQTILGNWFFIRTLIQVSDILQRLEYLSPTHASSGLPIYINQLAAFPHSSHVSILLA